MAGVSERSEMQANWYWGNALIVANSPIPGKPEVIQKRAWRGSTAMPPKPTSEASGGVHETHQKASWGRTLILLDIDANCKARLVSRVAESTRKPERLTQLPVACTPFLARNSLP